MVVGSGRKRRDESLGTMGVPVGVMKEGIILFFCFFIRYEKVKISTNDHESLQVLVGRRLQILRKVKGRDRKKMVT